MIVKNQSIEQAISRPEPAWRAMLFYGPDEGLISEYARRAARSIVADLSDAFRVIQLSGTELKSDPARLFDEAAAIAMFGGRRVIRLSAAGDAHAELLAGFLTEAKGDALLVIEAGELGKSSKLRKDFESAGNAAIIACYSDTQAELARMIRDAIKQHGFTIHSDAMAYLSDNLSDNRMINRQELEKLFIYMTPTGGPTAAPGGGRQITLADAQACIDDQGARGLDTICDAFCAGDTARLDRALSQAYADNLAPVAILRAAANHMLRLQLVAAHTAQGGSIDSAISALRPPVHFSRRDSFYVQARKWNLTRIANGLEILLRAETDCKTTGMPDLAICGRALLQLAQSVRAR